MTVDVGAVQPVGGRRSADEAKHCPTRNAVGGLAGAVGDSDPAEVMFAKQGAHFGASPDGDPRVGIDTVSEVGGHAFVEVSAAHDQIDRATRAAQIQRGLPGRSYTSRRQQTPPIGSGLLFLEQR